jgi:hypothetical protein
MTRRRAAPELGLGADLGGADHRRQAAGHGDLLAVEAEHDVAGAQARRRRRAVGQHLRHQGAARMTHAEGLRQLAGDVLDQDAEPAAADPPFSFSCSTTSMATSIGIAKDSPMKPPVRL